MPWLEETTHIFGLFEYFSCLFGVELFFQMCSFVKKLIENDLKVQLIIEMGYC